MVQVKQVLFNVSQNYIHRQLGPHCFKRILNLKTQGNSFISDCEGGTENRKYDRKQESEEMKNKTNTKNKKIVQKTLHVVQHFDQC